jgi:hypothetical protein
MTRRTRWEQQPAIVPDTGSFTSGRAESTILFHKNLHRVQIFVEKIKKCHAAAGELTHSFQVNAWFVEQSVTRVSEKYRNQHIVPGNWPTQEIHP